MGCDIPAKYLILRKMLEAAIYDQDIDIHFVLSLCISYSRESFINEMKKQIEMYI
jgi:hypothetical protein